MDFSRAECFETTAIGKSTSASRLHSFGIIIYTALRRSCLRICLSLAK
jgi:hypothetical protein